VLGSNTTITKAHTTIAGTIKKALTMPNVSANEPKISGDSAIARPAPQLALPIARSGLLAPKRNSRKVDKANCMDVPKPTKKSAINEAITLRDPQKTRKLKPWIATINFNL